MKIITVVGTRPEIIRLSQVIDKLNKHNFIKHILVHTGQNYDYELNQIFFNELELRKPDYILKSASNSSVSTIAKILIEIEPILLKEKPDAFLVLGDTNSCLCSIVAKKYKIPIFHMEAGNRCFDQRVPEETNRKIVDHISDINLTYSSIAREYLINEGFPIDRIIKTGSPMFEVLNNYKIKINKSSVLNQLSLKKKKYFVVSFHREENVETSNILSMFDTLNEIALTYRLPIIFSAHPRTQKRIKALKLKFNNLIQIMKPMGFFDYNFLQKNSKCVLSDSGTISEEASILKFKALNIRESHERPEAMEEGVVMMVGTNKNRILEGISLLSNQKNNMSNQVLDYTKNNVSEKIIRIIISYIDYVNKNVWKK